MPSIRLRHFLWTLLIILICTDIINAERYAVQRRADTASPTQSLTSAPSSTSNSKDASNTAGGSNSNSRSVAAKTTASSNGTSSSTTSYATGLPSSVNGNGAANFTSPIFNATLTPNELPLTPIITPGFSVAGVLLILSGAAYALIGMKNKMIHIFLSASYLASLGVTVLIIYVMNPPVSNAIQGAYVVAICMTGVIIGGASLIFTEMTEGLGCLFGGFCLSMWLLVLAPGGLLKTTGAISGFIAAFTVAVYATSFSHYTRPYGLIGSVSFGGATVVVMGIDCFSRAGLKEFWAYIWNLNENLFPLGATTYPLTKGIRVEIAAIIVIFLLGIVSQSRLWNVIKTQREKRAAQRLEEDKHTREEEANVGKRVEMENQRARGEWETVYGDKDAQMNSKDSGIGMGSPRTKGARSIAASTHVSGEDQIEMADMPISDMRGAGIATAKDGVMTVRVVEDDIPLGDDGKPIERALSQRSHRASAAQTWVVGTDGEARPASALSKRNSKRNSKRKSSGPDITPLPFTVPENEDEEIEDDRSSVATFATDVGKRGSMILRSLSKKSQLNPNRLSKISTTSEEKLVIPHVVEDDRSSVAATLDGISDDLDGRSLSGFSRPQSRASMSLVNEASPEADPKTAAEADAQQTSLTSSTGPKSAAAESSEHPTSPISDAPPPLSVKSTPSIPTALTKSALPPTVSKVVMSYRTNEWAKHLSHAEAPEPEALNLKSYANSSPTPTANSSGNGISKVVGDKTIQPEAENPIQADVEIDTETAAPLDVVELQKTATEGQVAPAPIRSVSQLNTRLSPPSAHRNNLRSYSYRNSSAPNIGATLVESPIEEDFSAQPPSPSFAQTAGNTLLGKRDNMIRSKSGTFTPMAPRQEQSQQFPMPGVGMQRSESAASYNSYGPSYNSASASPYGPSPMASQTHLHSSEPQSKDLRLDDDSLSLSARRSIIRQSSGSTPGISTRGSTVPRLPNAGFGATFDSHQPQRDRMSTIAPPGARESQLANWRASVAADLSGSNTPSYALTPAGSVTGNGFGYGMGNGYETGNVLVEEKRRAEWMKTMEEKGKKDRERMWDERMRSGDMVTAHREALRRMQREASKHV